jgi:Bacterial capsule synthesis protein PGA_cap
MDGERRVYGHRRAMRRRQTRRRRRVALAVMVVLLFAVARVTYLSLRGGSSARTAAPPNTPHVTTGAPSPGGSSNPTTSPPPPNTTVTISAVGDTMMGNTPMLPPDPGSYFSAVSSLLQGNAQIVFGNLEGTLTTATGSKCGTDSANCYAFRAPPAYAADLRHAGFTVMNNANNHSYDFGAAGQAQTVSALHSAGIAQTGLPGEITVVRVRGVRVAFVAFAPYSDTASLLDLSAAKALIQRARVQADLVVAYMHAGAEGSDADHVNGQEETYFGEDRGNPEAFAHMAVDAGADLVIASGPHVVRGVEFYHRRLIAYSLGNFAGYANFGLGGLLSTSCILHVTLRSDGTFVSGRIIPTELVGQGQPAPGGDAVSVIAQLSRDDFESHAARIGASGDISAP